MLSGGPEGRNICHHNCTKNTPSKHGFGISKSAENTEQKIQTECTYRKSILQPYPQKRHTKCCIGMPHQEKEEKLVPHSAMHAGCTRIRLLTQPHRTIFPSGGDMLNSALIRGSKWQHFTKFAQLVIFFMQPLLNIIQKYIACCCQLSV